MNNTKLKPCPFCGGNAVFNTISLTHGNHSVGFGFTIRCESCKLVLPCNYNIDVGFSKTGTLEITNDGRPEAISAWNRRADQ